MSDFNQQEIYQIGLNLENYLKFKGWYLHQLDYNHSELYEMLKQDICMEMTKWHIPRREHNKLFYLDKQNKTITINHHTITILDKKQAQDLKRAIETAIQSILNIFMFQQERYKFNSSAEYRRMMDLLNMFSSFNIVNLIQTEYHDESSILVSFDNITVILNHNDDKYSCNIESYTTPLSIAAKRFIEQLCIVFVDNYLI